MDKIVKNVKREIRYDEVLSSLFEQNMTEPEIINYLIDSFNKEYISDGYTLVNVNGYFKDEFFCYEARLEKELNK